MVAEENEALPAVRALIDWAWKAAEDLEGEFGGGLSYEKMLAAGNYDDVRVVEAARAELDAILSSSWLAGQLKQARADALEEAAQVAVDEAWAIFRTGQNDAQDALQRVADNVRAKIHPDPDEPVLPDPAA